MSLPVGHQGQVGAAQEMELAADGVAEQGGFVAEIVGKERGQRADGVEPGVPVKGGKILVVKEHGELDIGKQVRLAGGERTVHEDRNDAAIVFRGRAQAFDHLLLEHGTPVHWPGLGPAPWSVGWLQSGRMLTTARQ